METEKKKTKEVTVKNEVNNDILIQQAIESGASIEILERLFSLREKVKAEQAREAFVRALALFQSECPILKKNKKVLNKDGKSVRYQYTSLDSAIEQIKKALQKAELTYSFDVEKKNGDINVTAKITHILGHSETSSFGVPVGSTQYMTAPQAYASALTFAKRYSLFDALGILTGEEDTDAVDVNEEKDAKSVKSKIIFLLKKLGYGVNAKETVVEAVKNATQLELKKEKYEEIKERLEVLVKEKQEYDNSKV